MWSWDVIKFLTSAHLFLILFCYDKSNKGKVMKKSFIVFMSIFIIFGCSESQKYDVQDGDVIFQDSSSSQSQAIKLATHSNYSHVGIVYKRERKFYVYEAVNPVKSTPLKQWVARGVDKKFVLKRLKDSSLLTAKKLQKMQKVGAFFAKRPYDFLFGWKDDKLYCSELVWKIYKRGAGIELGKLKKLKEFDLSHPVVQYKLKERYGNNIPYDEDVIDPQGIFDSNLLKEVYRN